MAGSIYGKNFRVSTWGESHGKGLGACIDGCPAGLKICEEDIQELLNRRKPGQSKFTTARKEGDQVKVLSGIMDGVTLGTPIALSIENADQRSKDYSAIENVYRPGHADFGFDSKFGIRDHRGGGRSSGRETIGRVAAGAFAKKILKELGISVTAYAKQIGPYAIDEKALEESIKGDNPELVENKIRALSNNPFYMPDEATSLKAEEYVKELIVAGDSSGGIIECRIEGLKAGIGEPVFDKLDAELAKACFSIGTIKAFEIGAGFGVATMKASENNDSFRIGDNGAVTKTSNNSGGTLGGMSDSSSLIFRAAVKPTPSISMEQETVNKSGEEVNIKIVGRHDPIIVPRAVVVVEAMAAICLVDLLLEDMGARLSYIKDYYDKK